MEIEQGSTARRQRKQNSVLSDREVQAIKPSDKPFKRADGNGLFLLINPNGAKLWRFKYRVAGKEKLMALGEYPATSLAMARKAREDARSLLAQDIDPMAVRQREKLERRAAVENSFLSVATTWWDQWRTTRSSRHADHVWRRFQLDVFPAIGSRPVGAIDAPELVAMIKKIDKRGAGELARRALQTTGAVFRYAIAHGLATRNPAVEISAADVLAPRTTSNMARISARELPDLLQRIEIYEGAALTRLAMKLMAHTFVRTGELIGARWAEIDLEAARWDIPASRMKMKTPHIVPLSRQAISILSDLKLISEHREFVFPGNRNPRESMSNGAILGALRRMGYKGRMTGHGFRGLASTLLHEQGFDHAHIETQLAHQERNEVSAAYNHALYLRQRAVMMQAWSDYLDRVRRGDNVIPLVPKVA